MPKAISRGYCSASEAVTSVTVLFQVGSALPCASTRTPVFGGLVDSELVQAMNSEKAIMREYPSNLDECKVIVFSVMLI